MHACFFYFSAARTQTKAQKHIKSLKKAVKTIHVIVATCKQYVVG